MKLGNARYSLESAYVINKRTPGGDTWEKPTNTVVKAKVQQVLYDARRKEDRNKIVSTPEPPVKATATAGGLTSTNTRVQDYLEAGKVIAAAEKISFGHTQWARFCYDPLHDKKCGLFLTKALFCAWAISNRRPVKPKRVQLFEDMALICLIDTRHRMITGKKRFTPTQICQMLGYDTADKANWYRGLSLHYNFMYKIVDQIDGEVLRPVARTVSRIRTLDETVAG